MKADKLRVVMVAIGFAMVAEGQIPRPPRKASAPKATPKADSNASTSAAKAWPVAKLSVTGNKVYTEADILGVAGLKLGQVAGKTEFDAARDRLLATGLFDSVGYRFEPAAGTSGYLAVFQVVEVDQLYPYRFESLPIDPKEARAFLKQRLPLAGDRIPGTQALVERMRAAVQEFLKQKGHTMEVAGKLSAVEANKLEIVFQPTSLPAVAEVAFHGNMLVTTDELQRSIAGPGVGAIYTEEKFRQILEASIRPIYETRGRLRVAFPKIEVAPAKNVNGLALTVEVNEGPEFKLRDVKLAEPFQEDKALLKEGKFEIGELANIKRVRESVESMEASLRRRGYIETKSKIDRTIDDAAKSLDVLVNIDSGPQFTFGKLAIEGLDIETEPHIRKLWAMKSGAPYNAEYPAYFLHRIREDGVFDNLGATRSTITPDPARNQVDVTLIFKGEKPPPKIPLQP